ncbi:MAG: TetR/AcrR family transcriptional regulator [Alphaproteobacteria bacterium]
MRRSREATAQSRERIVSEAAQLFRERGIEGASVADVMNAAGMTHGGFYRHFPDKDALVAAAVDRAVDDVIGQIDQQAATEGLGAAISAYVSMYLSDDHVKSPRYGCPIAALASEARRAPETTRAAVTNGLASVVERIGKALPCEPEDQRPAALAMMAMLVGTVVLARSTADKALRDELLQAARAQAIG